jgi:hypothetical protein
MEQEEDKCLWEITKKVREIPDVLLCHSDTAMGDYDDSFEVGERGLFVLIGMWTLPLSSNLTKRLSVWKVNDASCYPLH